MVRVEEGEGAARGVGRAPLEAWLLRTRNVGIETYTNCPAAPGRCRVKSIT